MYACEHVNSDEVSEIDQNINFQFKSTNERMFPNLNVDILNLTPIESNNDPIYCPPDQPIPRHIPGIPEKLLAKHRLAGNVVPRPLINNYMVEPPISDTERICRQLLTIEDKVETTRVEELILESEPEEEDNESEEDIQQEEDDTESEEDIQQEEEDNESREDIPMVYHTPSRLIG